MLNYYIELDRFYGTSKIQIREEIR